MWGCGLPLVNGNGNEKGVQETEDSTKFVGPANQCLFDEFRNFCGGGSRKT